jgi:transposase
MSAKRYTEEFKIEATKQVTERNYKLSEVASRLGVSEPTLRNWVKKYGSSSSQHHTINDQQEELRKLKAELRRVTEERDILKEAAAFFAAESRKDTRS